MPLRRAAILDRFEVSTFRSRQEPEIAMDFEELLQTEPDARLWKDYWCMKGHLSKHDVPDTSAAAR